jgi:hypothetical protein
MSSRRRTPDKRRWELVHIVPIDITVIPEQGIIGITIEDSRLTLVRKKKHERHT